MEWIIGSPNYGGREVPQSAICKLKTQEIRWCHSVWLSMPANQRSQRNKSKSQGRRRWDEMSQFSSGPGVKGSNSFSLHLLFYSRPQEIEWCPSTFRRTISLMSSPIQMLISVGNILTDILRYNQSEHLRHIKLTIALLSACSCNTFMEKPC